MFAEGEEKAESEDEVITCEEGDAPTIGCCEVEIATEAFSPKIGRSFNLSFSLVKMLTCSRKNRISSSESLKAIPPEEEDDDVDEDDESILALTCLETSSPAATLKSAISLRKDSLSP